MAPPVYCEGRVIMRVANTPFGLPVLETGNRSIVEAEAERLIPDQQE